MGEIEDAPPIINVSYIFLAPPGLDADEEEAFIEESLRNGNYNTIPLSVVPESFSYVLDTENPAADHLRVQTPTDEGMDEVVLTPYQREVVGKAIDAYEPANQDEADAIENIKDKL